MKFSYTEDEIKVLTNFASINPNIVIFPDKFISINGPQASLIGIYNLEKDYDFEPFGIFDLNMFLQLMKQFKQHELEAHGNYVSVAEKGENGVKFNTTPIEMIKTIPDDKLEANYNKVNKSLDFTYTAEALNTLKRVTSILKSERLFFQIESDKLKITAADEIIENSVNPYIVKVQDEFVKLNKLDKNTILYIKMEELKLLEGEYEVGMAVTERGGISLWKNTTFPIRYYIGVFKV